MDLGDFKDVLMSISMGMDLMILLLHSLLLIHVMVWSSLYSAIATNTPFPDIDLSTNLALTGVGFKVQQCISFYDNDDV